jgi:Flp pilus assembly protein TadG
VIHEDIMISFSQLTGGVEWVWLIWLATVAVLLKMLGSALRRWRRPRWSQLARGEEGLSYTLSYVLVFPIFFLFVCVVFEATWLLMAKIGTMYAAHAGARSQVVWTSAQTQEIGLGNKRTYQAVWTAMTPFVTGDPGANRIPTDAYEQAIEYLAAYQANLVSGDPYANAPASALTSRFLCAAARTDWHSTIDPHSHGDVKVTVTYRAPLHIPGAARVLAAKGQGPFEYAITSSATLPNEAPASPDGTLGIEYQSR